MADDHADASVDFDALAACLQDTLEVATDPRQLKPSQLLRLINSTPLGTVLGERRLLRHRQRAGLAIGTETTIDLFRYAAWLHRQRHAGATTPAVPTANPATPTSSPTAGGDAAYERHKEAAAARQSAIARSGRDIGELPPVVDPARKAAAQASLKAFCESYFPATFNLPWSEDHLRVMAKIETAVKTGGLFAMAMPRGTGKTTLCVFACLWAVLCGHCEFVCLIAATQEAANGLLESAKTEFETNELLAQDFPEVCFPILKLDGIHQRKLLYRGKRIRVHLTGNRIVLPDMEGHPSCAGVIEAHGLTSHIRGRRFSRPDGRKVRPSLVLLDDPQTHESAFSDKQCDTRLKILNGDVLGMAGPGKTIAGLAAVTVMRKGDLADQLLSRDKAPEWTGERCRLMYAEPTNHKLWDQYAELRLHGLKSDQGQRAATEFYRKHQQAMDAGAKVAWPERFLADEVSAVQHAMNLKLRDPHSFFAEMQNDPRDAIATDETVLTREQIDAKRHGLKRWLVPAQVQDLTAFIDVQQKVLFYAVVGWTREFSGYVVDYGAWPEQGQAYFTAARPAKSLDQMYRSGGLEGRLYRGLSDLVAHLCMREWKRDGGGVLPLGLVLIDAGWGLSTDTVYAVCRESPHRGVIQPSHGKGIGASGKPMSEWAQRPGETSGLNWRLTSGQGTRAIRHVVFDVNAWKSLVMGRWQTPLGDPGSLSVWGSARDSHKLFTDHQLAEKPVRTSGRGRSLEEWKLRPERPDNHWWDCVVGAAVAASIRGCQLPGTQTVTSTRRKFRLPGR